MLVQNVNKEIFEIAVKKLQSSRPAIFLECSNSKILSQSEIESIIFFFKIH